MWAEDELERILNMKEDTWIWLRQFGEGGVIIEFDHDEYTASEINEYGDKQTGYISFKRKDLNKLFEVIDKWT